MDIYNKPSPQEFLAHHGVKGMKWGVRRYQNEDGTLTAAGKQRRISVRQASLDAKKAAKTSFQKDKSSPDKVTIRRAFNNAKKAHDESIAEARGISYEEFINKQLLAKKVSDLKSDELVISIGMAFAKAMTSSKKK